MTTTANLAATKIDVSQAQKEVTANQAFDVFDAALSQISIAMTDANYTLSLVTTPQEWQYGILSLTGTLTAARNVVVPLNKKQYVVVNGTTGGFAVTLKTSAGTGIAVAAGVSAILRCDGANVAALSAGSGVGTVTSVAASVPAFLSVAGSPITTAGTLAITYSGTALPVANGGTGGTTASAARTALGLAIGSDVQAYDANAVTHTGGALTANSVVLGAGTGDTKTVAGMTTDGTSALTLGVAGTSVGKVVLANATSGSITVQPATGALGAVTLTAPATTGTLALLAQITGTNSGTNTGDETTTTEGALVNGATPKTTPVDADYVGLMDSAASNILKKLSWANIKATLKTYFDTLYGAGSGSVVSVATSGGVETLSGSAITTSGTLRAGETVNAQTGTNYTFVDNDRAKLVTHSNAAAIAGTLPQAGASSTFVANWFMDVQNRGAGALTITPATSTIDGTATLVLATGQGARIVSDGTNYFTQRGMGSSSAGVRLDQITTGTADTTLSTSGTVTLNSGAGTAAAGKSIAIKPGAGGATNNAGGTLLLQGGDGTGAGGGGILTVQSGSAGATGYGAVLNLNGGAAGATSGNGGGVNISGAGAAGAGFLGGPINITAGAATVSGAGAAVTLTGGAAASGAGGPVNIVSGASSGLGYSSGAISITTPDGINTNGVAGAIVIAVGASQNAQPGGALTQTAGTGGSSGGAGGTGTWKGGTGGGAGAGGEGKLKGGTPGATGAAGPATVEGGTPIAGAGGSVNIWATAGIGTSKAGGNVSVKPGPATGTGNPGNIQLDGGNGAALATTAIGGFVTIPTCAGTPTGTPVNVPTGSVPMVFDTTGVKLWIYTGGAWKGALFV